MDHQGSPEVCISSWGLEGEFIWRKVSSLQGCNEKKTYLSSNFWDSTQGGSQEEKFPCPSWFNSSLLSLPSLLTSTQLLFPFMLNLSFHFIFSIALKDVLLVSSSVCSSIPMFLPSLPPLCPEADLYGAASAGLARPLASDWVGQCETLTEV